MASYDILLWAHILSPEASALGTLSEGHAIISQVTIIRDWFIWSLLHIMTPKACVRCQVTPILHPNTRFTHQAVQAISFEVLPKGPEWGAIEISEQILPKEASIIILLSISTCPFILSLLTWNSAKHSQILTFKISAWRSDTSLCNFYTYFFSLTQRKLPV